MAKFKFGAKDYALGSHWIWEFSRMIYQSGKKPYLLGGLVLLSGYMWSMVRRVERPVSTELIKFRHREQMQRLKDFVGRRRDSPQSHLEASSTR